MRSPKQRPNAATWLALLCALLLTAPPALAQSAEEDPGETAAAPWPTSGLFEEDGGDGGGFFAPEDSSLEDFLESLEAQRSASEVLVEGIAAQVGGDVVLISEVRALAAPIEARMRKAGVSDSEIRAMRSDALERLIEARLIEEVVRRAQLSASDAEVDAAIGAIAQENGLSIEQMQASIASHGLTVDEYRGKIKSEIERQKVLSSMVRSRVRIEESELRAMYSERYGTQPDTGSEVRLRHLLVAFGTSILRDDDTACRLVEETRRQIEAGELDFPRAAANISDVNAERGGDLGWVHLEELAGWMQPVVESLQTGQLSDVVRMSFGCNLLQVVDRREYDPVTYEEARPQIEQALFSQKMEEEYTTWIDKIRETVYIERKGVYAEAGRLAEEGVAAR